MKFFLFIILTGLSLVTYAQKNTFQWVQETKEAAWKARDSQGEFVFKDKIWIAGGAAEPDYKLDSEVWSLSLPEKWFAGQ